MSLQPLSVSEGSSERVSYDLEHLVRAIEECNDFVPDHPSAFVSWATSDDPPLVFRLPDTLMKDRNGDVFIANESVTFTKNHYFPQFTVPPRAVVYNCVLRNPIEVSHDARVSNYAVSSEMRAILTKRQVQDIFDASAYPIVSCG